MPARYRKPEIDRVEIEHDGLPIRLVLQVRDDILPPFPTLSWRTNLPSARVNRYTYKVSGNYWTVSVDVSLSILRQAEERGMLNEEHDDPQERHNGPDNRIMHSQLLNAQDRDQLYHEITTDHDECNWGAFPEFVVMETPDGTWRKIMIIDSEREFCTFRSTTTDRDYGRGSDRGMRPPWLLDTAMQDASTSMMREFLRVLQGVI